jgi:hypothetical protein
MAMGVRLVILGFWVGVMALFSFVVAPAAFTTLPTQQLAGTIVSRVLAGVEIIGLAAGIVLVSISILLPLRRKNVRLVEFGLLVLMTVSMAISRFVVSARLHDLRAQFGERLALLSSDEPVRRTFDLLHHVSVGLMGFTLCSAIALAAVLIWSRPDTVIASPEARNDA